MWMRDKERERHRQTVLVRAQSIKCIQGKQGCKQRQGKEKYLQAMPFFKSPLLAFTVCPVCYCLYKQQNQYGRCSDPAAGGAHQWSYLQNRLLRKGNALYRAKYVFREALKIKCRMLY